MTAWYNRISFKAVAIGGVVDIVATNLLMLPIIIPLLSTVDDGKHPGADRTAALTALMDDRPMVFLAGLVLGGIASMFGGWLAARLARREYVLHGALSAWACIALGLFGFQAGGDAVPLWQHVVFLFLSPAVGAIGGRIYAWQSVRWPKLATPVASMESEADAGVAPLSGTARVVYALNRTVWLMGLLFGTLFACMLVYALVRRDPTMILGAAFLTAACVGSVVLARSGARQLRAASSRHWGYQIGSLALILLPIAAMALPMVAARSR